MPPFWKKAASFRSFSFLSVICFLNNRLVSPHARKTCENLQTMLDPAYRMDRSEFLFYSGHLEGWRELNIYALQKILWFLRLSGK
ncbi:hypothetical protein [Komagataeibacter xylinus]|uniref:hypothetical protein n=1 Tax=Komagataeibacter xylinus TaxID=28448 RepID=UPI0013EE4CB2|nr:hypothetical protein [Komagataeibacter xylinus]